MTISVSKNGKILDSSNLERISIHDSGILRGYGVFDYLITYNHKPFFLDRHIERLFASAKIIELLLPYSQDTVREWALETISNYRGKDEMQIRLIATGGVGPDTLSSNREEPTLIIEVSSRRANPKELLEIGIKAETATHQRSLAAAKTINYLEGMIFLQKARCREAREIIFVSDGQVREGMTSNVFAVLGGELCTPQDKILLGVTREVILNKLELSCSKRIREITLKELTSASEVFVTASNKEIMPVTVLDGEKVGNGSVGPITKQVMQRFGDFAQCS